MASHKNDIAFKTSSFSPNDSQSDSDPQTPPHFLTEDRLRPSNSKETGEESVSFEKENPQMSFYQDLPYGPSGSSSFLGTKTYDAAFWSQDETPVKPPVKHERDRYLINIEDRPRSSNSFSDSKPSSRLSFNGRESGSDWSGRMHTAVDIKTQQTLQQKEASKLTFNSIMSYSPKPRKYHDESCENTLQSASAKLTVKNIVVRSS